MGDPRLAYLFYRHFDGLATFSEKRELARAIEDQDKGAEVRKLMEEAWAAYTSDEDTISPKSSESILRNILKTPAAEPAQGQSWWNVKPQTWWYAAASMLIMLGFVLYNYRFINSKSAGSFEIAAQKATREIVPGSDRAVLTLADGKVIDLEKASEGLLSKQGSSQVSKSENGRLVYQTNAADDGPILYNTVSTPRGGQYQITLPDGSRVWLNAASSIRYPTAFTGTERLVEITGEAYFEVEKNVKMPFRVQSPAMQVRVLGTHFNINSYEDETVARTTLLEGAVEVTRDMRIVRLRPGQQADVLARVQGANIQVREGDVSKAIAWKEGFFQFNQAGLPDVMRQLSRWYDVEVSYMGNIAPREFGGEISRQANLSEVLKILEISNVHFRVEGRKIVVTP